MKLTIGMATYDDYDGVYFTVQALRTYHPEAIEQCEIIVVDNNPGTKTGEYIQCLLEKWGKGIAGAKYVPMPSPQGTTQPRNRIFQEASGDAVLVIDSHVLLVPGCLIKLLEYYEQHPNTPNLLSGPLLYDDFSVCGTQFDDQWRDGMWGTWGTNKHQLEAGEPFDIPGMGLGLFSCRREAWLGFNTHFRGFGGEEMYIHEKFRLHGASCLCLPWLRWLHRFGRPNGTTYDGVTYFHRVRNYILGLQELGLPLDRLYQHFVIERRLGRGQWLYLLDDPINHVEPYFPPGYKRPVNVRQTRSITMDKIMEGKP